jgi:hypothetical protein
VSVARAASAGGWWPRIYRRQLLGLGFGLLNTVAVQRLDHDLRGDRRDSQVHVEEPVGFSHW